MYLENCVPFTHAKILIENVGFIARKMCLVKSAAASEETLLTSSVLFKFSRVHMKRISSPRRLLLSLLICLVD